ncbi:MAG: glycosyltransferase [Thermodesulfobacteriota bacterium]
MQADNHPKVSILIPCYNHAAFIEETIRSVWEQDYSNLELVIVDDGSIDNSREIISRLAVISPIVMIVVEQENAGICRALNRALKHSTGQIIGFLASDDMMLPERLNQEVRWFELEPMLKVLYSNGRFQSDGRIFGDAHKLIKPYLKRGIASTRDHLLSTAPGFYIQAMLIKRDFLLNLGGFDEETGSDDWSLNIRIFQALMAEREYEFLDRYAFLYRVHETQLHRTNGFMQPMTRKVVRKYFSLKNRSKFVCQNCVKKAFGLFLQRRFKLGGRYITKACYIGFSKGIPVTCLMRFGFDFPGYAYRELMRRLKTK